MADFLWQLSNFELWDHPQFSSYNGLSFLPPGIAPIGALIAGSITRSSYIGSVELDIYKNRGVVLSSAQDFWKGRLGYQQWPWMAAIGEQSVFTRSGIVEAGDAGNSNNANSTLPYIDQDENVALIMYRHNWDLPLFGWDNFDISLHWSLEDFDESRTFDQWTIARTGENYVAVKKHCEGLINGLMACDDQDGQTWAVVVGNAHTHQSFDHFETVIRASEYEERWYFNWRTFKWIYYGRIKVDGKEIDYAWGGGLFSGPANARAEEELRNLQIEAREINIYPNPASEQFTIDLSGYGGDLKTLRILNTAGQLVFTQQFDGPAFDTRQISTGNWGNGLYTILLDDGVNVAVKRLIIQK